MDLNDIRAGLTLLCFVLFIALVVHTWSRRRSSDHAQAAWLPFAGEPPQAARPLPPEEAEAGGGSSMTGERPRAGLPPQAARGRPGGQPQGERRE